MTGDLPDLIFDLKDPESFSGTALRIFKFQAGKNPIYRHFISSLGIDTGRIKNITEIPFLPAELFKSQIVAIENLPFETVFESSGTTVSIPGRHFIHDLKLYEKSFLKSFRFFYGEPSEYLIAALLPSYTERKSSSLVYMMNGLIEESRNKNSGFYNDNLKELIDNIHAAKISGQKTFLLGVALRFLTLQATTHLTFRGPLLWRQAE